ncbi:MAG: acyltransferase [Raoultibacter sp.]
MEDFESGLQDYLSDKRNEMKEKYNRVLPTGELLFNRFDKAEYLKCDTGSSVYDTSVVMGDVVIGKNVWVGPYTLLEGINDDLVIGDHVSINAGVMIYTHDSTKHYLSGGKVPLRTGKVTIGNNSVIGAMSTVSCGVTIGEHCVVAAHSFVSKDVPDNSIVAGVPARLIGKVFVTEDDVCFEFFDHQEK